MKISRASDVVEIRDVHKDQTISTFEWPKPKGVVDPIYPECFWVGHEIIRPSYTERGDLYFQKATVPEPGGSQAKELNEFYFKRTDCIYAINYPLVCVFEPNLKYRVINLLEKGENAVKTHRLIGV